MDEHACGRRGKGDADRALTQHGNNCGGQAGGLARVGNASALGVDGRDRQWGIAVVFEHLLHGRGDAANPHGRVHQCGGIAADAANAVVENIRNEQAASAVERDRVRTVQAGDVRRAAVAEELLTVRAGDRSDNAGVRIDFANTIVAGVRDVDVSGNIDGDPGGRGELCRGGRDVVIVVAGDAGTGQRLDDAGRVDLAQDMVTLVGDVQLTRSGDGDAPWAVQGSHGGRSAIPRVGRDPSAGDGRDEAGDGVHAANGMITAVCEIKLSGGVKGEPIGRVQQRGGGRAAVTGVAMMAGCADDGGDDAGKGVNAADNVVARIREVQVAGRVNGDPGG